MAESATALVQTVEGGHLFYADDYDPSEVETFYHSEGFHNGPGCAACEESWCVHCERVAGRNLYTETCWAVQEEGANTLVSADDAGARITRQWEAAP